MLAITDLELNYYRKEDLLHSPVVLQVNLSKDTGTLKKNVSVLCSDAQGLIIFCTEEKTLKR